MVLLLSFCCDDTVESLIIYGFHYQEGSYGIEDGKSPATVPIILASKQLKNTFSKQGAYLKNQFEGENFDYPSVNVIAKVDGTDPKLKEEYVLFSGHQDHDGVALKLTVTPIWNGADDNASR
jgi:hypothetical protein